MSTISNAWGKMTALSSREVNNVTATGVQLALAPKDLNPSIFESWRREDQVAYVNAKGSGSPKSVAIGPPGKEVTASLPTEATFKVTSGGRQIYETGLVEPAKDADFNLGAGQLPPATFLSWTPAEQARYLKKEGRDAIGSSVTIGGSTGKGTIAVAAVQDVALAKGPIIQPDTAADIPYYNLAGSSAGMPSAFVMDKAEELFPSLNGTTVTLPVGERPAAFYTNPTSLTTEAAQKAFLTDFTNWHSAYQLEYMKQWTTGTSGVLAIPSIGTPILAAFISKADPTKFFIMNSLDKAAFARMEKADQDFASTESRLAASFAAVAVKVGLGKITVANVPSAVDPTATPKTAAAAVQELIDYMNSESATNLRTVTATIVTGIFQDSTVETADSKTVTTYKAIIPPVYTKTVEVSAKLPEVDRKAWTDQLAILQEQLAGMGVIAPKDFSKKLTDLKERFDRAFAFFDVKKPTAADNNNTDSANQGDTKTAFTVYNDVISQKGDISGIERGYKIFLSQEKRIAELVEGRMQIVRDDGVLFGKRLDVPELVFRFQSSYNLQLEAQTVAETEEINQQNDLLKTYAAMQDIINQTLSKFAKADEGNKRILGISNLNDIDAISDDNRKIIAMFEDAHGTGQKHPLEKLRGINRPLQDVWKNENGDQNFDLYERSHSQWSQFGTRLSETVTIINQNSQLKMNDVNSMDKQRNRHFELANSALSKMNEMLNNIARAG